MKMTEFIKRVSVDRDRLCIVEYRTVKPDDRDWRDPATGRVLSFANVRHGVESGADQVTVIERMPEGTKAADAKVPFKKGDLCVLAIRTLVEVKGEHTATGTLEPLTQ